MTNYSGVNNMLFLQYNQKTFNAVSIINSNEFIKESSKIIQNKEQLENLKEYKQDKPGNVQCSPFYLNYKGTLILNFPVDLPFTTIKADNILIINNFQIRIGNINVKNIIQANTITVLHDLQADTILAEESLIVQKELRARKIIAKEVKINRLIRDDKFEYCMSTYSQIKHFKKLS